MYPEHFSLPFVTGVLIAAAERRRPGLGAWNAQSRADLEAVFRAELVDVRRQFFELFDDRAYWDKLEASLFQVALPRYLAVAEPQTALELKHFGLWRGGDLLARGAYMAAGLAIGIIMVKVPFIPIPQTWDFFAFFTALGAPFIPDLQEGWHKRKFRRALTSIVEDMREAAESSKLYQPLGTGAIASVVDVGGEPEKTPAPRGTKES
jgi:hypothetical protein